MITEPVQYQISGRDAAGITRSIERGVLRGQLLPGQVVPSVRALARQLEISPTTVAAAYRDLKLRGILVTHDRSRTTVSHRPALSTRLSPELPDNVVDLATGNPDPALLPHLADAISRLAVPHRLYADDPALPALADLARASLEADGVTSDQLAIVGGGLDGVERLLEVHTRVGDRVIIEDPCYIGTIDLVRTLGLDPVPVAVDDEGLDPGELEEALTGPISAAVITPRAHNPTGAAWSHDRARAIGALLAAQPDVMVIEVDAAGLVSGSAYRHIAGNQEHWAVVRSLSKALGPDLRVAVVTGDSDTMVRLLGRQRLGTGWTSYVLQQLAADLWQSSLDHGWLDVAAATYQHRRQHLVSALNEHAINAHATSGLNVWIPVDEEVPVVQGLAARGWAVQAGEPFRVRSEPAVRVTIAGLADTAVDQFAADMAEVFDQRLGTRRG